MKESSYLITLLKEDIHQLMMDLTSQKVISMITIQAVKDQKAESAPSRNNIVVISIREHHRDTEMREVILEDMIISAVVDGH